MPAITLSRLRQQAALLADHFDEPDAFVRSLHHLLEFYSDRTRRPGQAGTPPPLTQSYRVPAPVLRQVLLELSPHAAADLAAGLALCDRLWDEPILEFRTLAASLLGSLPANPAGPVLERVERWSRADAELRLVHLLVDDGLASARREAPEQALGRIKTWLRSNDPPTRQLGLLALLPSLAAESDAALPELFRLLGPSLRTPAGALRPDLLEVLRALARRSPKESAYLLQQAMELPHSPELPAMIRQLAPEFPPELQPALRAAARGR